MSPRHPSTPKWSAESEADKKGLPGSATFSPLQPSGLLSKTATLVVAILPNWDCVRRTKHTKRNQSQGKGEPKMCVLIRADNGSPFQTVDMGALSQDMTVGAMVISEELAGRLLQRKELWRKISPRAITDDQGVNHICQHLIKVSWRWGSENCTSDAKVYISSKLRNVDLLVPGGSGPLGMRSTPTVQPNYYMPRQTQEERDRQKKNNEIAKKAHEEATRTAQQEKAKKFGEALKKAGQASGQGSTKPGSDVQSFRRH